MYQSGAVEPEVITLSDEKMTGQKFALEAASLRAQLTAERAQRTRLAQAAGALADGVRHSKQNVGNHLRSLASVVEDEIRNQLVQAALAADTPLVDQHD